MAALYIIATPIGNLEDISIRAKNLLEKVELVAAEDTRQTSKLFKLLGIRYKEIVAYHDHNEAEQSQAIVNRMLASDIDVALVSDAGTPCISDPGYRLVRAAHEAGIKVHPIPGASAFISLVSASGLASNRLLFEGFLPVKQMQLEKQIKSWKSLGASIVFFESARRVARTMEVLQTIYPQSRIAIGRELTKMYEEIVQLDISAANEWIRNHNSLKGELVLMLELGEVSDELDDEQITAMAEKMFHDGMKHKDVLKEILQRLDGSGPNKSELYQKLLSIKDSL